MFSHGQKLYLLRIRKGLTQAQVSARSGIRQANLSNIEKGKHDPTVTTFLNLCAALDVSPQEAFEEDSPSEPPALGRASAERIAKGVLDPEFKITSEEREIADLLRNVIPGFRRRTPPVKKIHQDWYKLKKRLPGEAIRMLAERIQDEEARSKARAERDYEKLVAKLEKLFGRRR